MIKNNLKYLIEGFVIIFSIFISFYIEDVRKGNEDFETKNELVGDLIVSLEDDLVQMDNLIDILKKSFPNLKNLNILILGIAYKEGTNTTRRSHSLEIASKLSNLVSRSSVIFVE